MIFMVSKLQQILKHRMQYKMWSRYMNAITRVKNVHDDCLYSDALTDCLQLNLWNNPKEECRLQQ